MSKNRFLGGVAALVLVSGCLIAAVLFYKSGLRDYPSLIADAYKDPLQKVEIPGEADIELSRRGAYGVYYEGDRGVDVDAELPPTLDCSLTLKRTGNDVPLVQDYVPTNQYVTKDGERGVLIYSTTVEDPGLHTLSCEYPDGLVGPQLVLAIGPNYFWEFLRVAWDIGGPVLGAAGVICGSIILSFGIALIALVRGSKFKQVGWRKVRATRFNNAKKVL
jgi:hypothetical protein